MMNTISRLWLILGSGETVEKGLNGQLGDARMVGMMGWVLLLLCQA